MDTRDNRLSRRVILQGAGAIALVGLGNLSFGLATAFAAANDDLILRHFDVGEEHFVELATPRHRFQRAAIEAVAVHGQQQI